jgi:hypothetical protein
MSSRFPAEHKALTLAVILKQTVMLYLFMTIFFGLLQIWALALYLTFRQVNFDVPELLKDGGLFFFATSLAASAFVTHYKAYKSQRHRRKEEIIWGYAFVAVILFICIIGFCSGVNIIDKNQPVNMAFNSTHLRYEVISSILAVIYGYIAEVKSSKTYSSY